MSSRIGGHGCFLRNGSIGSNLDPGGLLIPPILKFGCLLPPPWNILLFGPTYSSFPKGELYGFVVGIFKGIVGLILGFYPWLGCL